MEKVPLYYLTNLIVLHDVLLPKTGIDHQGVQESLCLTRWPAIRQQHTSRHRLAEEIANRLQHLPEKGRQVAETHAQHPPGHHRFTELLPVQPTYILSLTHRHGHIDYPSELLEERVL